MFLVVGCIDLSISLKVAPKMKSPRPGMKPSEQISSTKLQVALPTSLPIIGIKRIFDFGIKVPQVTKFGIAVRALLVILTAYITKLRNKFESKLQMAANAMEAGWTKRGAGNTFSRTIEVWFFAISFYLRYVGIFWLIILLSNMC